MNWCSPASPPAPAAIYDTNGAIVAAAIDENGGEAVFLGAIPDEEAKLEAAMRRRWRTATCWCFGRHLEGRGRCVPPHHRAARQPGIIAHGVALKPGKPLCLAVCDGKPVVILPGFPTSAMFTFHDMIVPVLRRMAGSAAALRCQGEGESAGAHRFRARPHRIRHGFAGRGRRRLDRLSDRQRVWRDHVLRAGRRFSQDRRARRPDAGGTEAEVTLFTPHVRVPDLVIVGSHCTGLDLVTAPLAHAGLSVRSIAVGSLGGLAAAQARRMRPRADPSVRRQDRDLQHALSRRGT